MLSALHPLEAAGPTLQSQVDVVPGATELRAEAPAASHGGAGRDDSTAHTLLGLQRRVGCWLSARLTDWGGPGGGCVCGEGQTSQPG